jgi:3'-phosphoadenosine 5'-phosphosulfate sulfotransferase (PAPS reductase)/FAD synthetase
MDTTPDLTSYDIILINTSAGKDSQAMLEYVVDLAMQAGVQDRLVAVHCDLGRVEWGGTKELAQEQCDAYGVPMHVVSRPQGDLLTQIEARGMFPSSTARYCTSDQKTGQVAKLLTKLTAEHAHLGRQVRILNCLGIRAEESSARAKKESFGVEKSSNGKRMVHRWFPIFHWTADQVWASIHASGVPYHPAYDAGMDRLSCVFCVLSTEHNLVLAAKLNPELAAEYAAVEVRIGHRFQNKLSMAEIIEKAAA